MENNSTVEHTDSIATDRRNIRNGHQSAVLWITGLSGSGKSTIAYELQERLFEIGCTVVVLDGDNIRSGLCKDLSFSDLDRSENMRRISEVSKIFYDVGVITIVAMISPFKNDRKKAKNLFGGKNFFEIYAKCSLTICEYRDVKGFYARARKGEVKNFTAVGSAYEEPENPDLVLDTECESIENVTKTVLHMLRVHNIFKGS